jgi:glycosyltransferase involved in cell wall biosynthesis
MYNPMPDNLPKVSVIVPVYNDMQGLQLCIAALKCQAYPREKFEIVVVDNGSNPPISESTLLDPLVRLVKAPKAGAYSARNVGASYAGGEVFAFTDADCEPEQQWLLEGVTALLAAGNRTFVGGEVTLRESDCPTAVERYQCLVGFSQKENIEMLKFSATANLFMFKSQFEAVGQFDEALLSGGDREWAWRSEHMGYQLLFASEARVVTHPRKSLSGAIRQARRVAGGRYMLRSRLDNERVVKRLKPIRSVGKAARRILTNSRYTIPNRIGIFCVAALIKLTHEMEKVRLALGFKAERR